MTPNRYQTPQGFKVALETRLRHKAQTPAVPISRVRQLLVFDRWLARLVAVLGDRLILKGGIALELRLARARTTRDVDVRVSGPASEVPRQLTEAAAHDAEDHLSFTVALDRHHPQIRGESVVYEGQRFRVQAHLAGQTYGDPFGMDVAHGDPILRMPDRVTSGNWLDFIGIAPVAVLVVPRETHVAEKLHAYTLPRERENSRIKDLPDLALLAQTGAFAARDLREAIRLTFTFRKTHAIPDQLPPPPAAWTDPYQTMSRDDALPWLNLKEAMEAARAFVDPVLEGIEGTWDPATWTWQRD